MGSHCRDPWRPTGGPDLHPCSREGARGVLQTMTDIQIVRPLYDDDYYVELYSVLSTHHIDLLSFSDVLYYSL